MVGGTCADAGGRGAGAGAAGAGPQPAAGNRVFGPGVIGADPTLGTDADAPPAPGGGAPGARADDGGRYGAQGVSQVGRLAPASGAPGAPAGAARAGRSLPRPGHVSEQSSALRQGACGRWGVQRGLTLAPCWQGYGNRSWIRAAHTAQLRANAEGACWACMLLRIHVLACNTHECTDRDSRHRARRVTLKRRAGHPGHAGLDVARRASVQGPMR
jgi:hypothetical protein